ncbi:unnamed protein product, partial [Bubo scandiacus]
SMVSQPQADRSKDYNSSVFEASPGILKAVMNREESLAGFKETFTLCPFYLIVAIGKEVSDVWGRADPHPFLF